VTLSIPNSATLWLSFWKSIWCYNSTRVLSIGWNFACRRSRESLLWSSFKLLGIGVDDGVGER